MFIDKLKRDFPNITMDERSMHRLGNAVTFFIDETGDEFSDKDKDKVINRLPSKFPFDNIFLQLRHMGIWVVSGDGCFYTLSLLDTKKIPVSLTFLDDRPLLFYQGIIDEENNISGFRVKGKAQDMLPADYGEILKSNQVRLFMSHLWFIRPFLEILTCKNIRTKQIVPARKKKYHKKPLFSYYVLQIQTNSGSGQFENKGLWSNRVHLCRGHIKTYTKEKPLFGKYVGNVWCPPHARGNKNLGVIAKDYKVATA
jgi:hypothetical protein